MYGCSKKVSRHLFILQVSGKYKFFSIFHCIFFLKCFRYYSGEKIAPVLTIFIGGNHEASNYLQELPYGGWVAHNIYYMGYASVIKVGGITIAGISGIYKGYNFHKGRHEFSPYSEETKRSVYHIRKLDVFRLKQMSNPIDICLSHDWPRGVYNYGDVDKLLKVKSFFEEEISQNKLGSPPCEELLNHIKPSYWFSAHLHCKFSALIPHETTDKFTKFLALDKCLPRRKFLQILDIGDAVKDGEKLELFYDLEWLTILSLTNHLISVKNVAGYMPGPGGGKERYDFKPTDEEMELVLRKFENSLKIPENFRQTVEAYKVNSNKKFYKQPPSEINPQTTLFCDTLQIDDPLSLAMLMAGKELNHSNFADISNNEDLDETISVLNETVSPLKRAPLASSLPTPMWTIDTNSEDLKKEPTTSFVDDHFPEVAEGGAPLWIVDTKPDDSSLSEQPDPPSVKKFKRRNQEIYSQTEDD